MARRRNLRRRIKRTVALTIFLTIAIFSGTGYFADTPWSPAVRATTDTVVSSGETIVREIAPARPEIHCKHFFHGYPAGTPATNDLIIRDIYAMSTNDDTKFADWVAYRLDRATVYGNVKTQRNWKPDPWLDPDETLEPDDYRGAFAELHTDRGHQAPLAAFKGTPYWEETNYLSNITPQRSDLNQGVWVELEGYVRDLALSNTVYIMTGPVFEREMPSMPGADEPHRVPSGYWKIVCVANDKGMPQQGAAFFFDQETPRNSPLSDHVTTIDEIEQRTGLDFLWELDDPMEDAIERDANADWVKNLMAG
ncbi:DNA/RNA non-specific endonuclease [bacterium]|nr:DNA/RNA non-specific endonuclease [bacterium]